MLYVATLNDADVELVDVGGQGVVDSLLQLADVFLSSEFSDDGETCVLNIEDGIVDSFDIMF